MIVEYRTWTSVANVPYDDEPAWTRLTTYLEREHAELGPVATWQDDNATLVLVLSDDAPDPATAAECATKVLSEALHACDMADRFPTVFHVEPVTGLLAA